MVKDVRIYTEGDNSLREGFDALFGELRRQARFRKVGWRTVLCGSGEAAYDRFRNALSTSSDTFTLLLVDSEGPVECAPWELLARRNRWTRLGLHDDHCHLMVQTMEAWFVADVDALSGYYRHGFRASVLPKSKDVESIAKERLTDSLREATRATQKGASHKTKHAPGILRRLNADTVRKAAPHCDRLFRVLAAQLELSIPSRDGGSPPT